MRSATVRLFLYRALPAINVVFSHLQSYDGTEQRVCTGHVDSRSCKVVVMCLKYTDRPSMKFEIGVCNNLVRARFQEQEFSSIMYFLSSKFSNPILLVLPSFSPPTILRLS